jgi:tetratricopeptide (TPR) repeat protein
MIAIRHKCFLAAALLACSTSSHAATSTAGDKAQYEHCLARAAANATDALREALEWQKAGGGPASEHCVAVALVALHRYGDAATKLDALAHGGFASDPSMRMDLYDQAGNAWLLANKPDNAAASFTAALSIDPADADLLADRARANAMRKSWASAESDLTAALLVNPGRADLLVLRGSARHALRHKAEARADFERALKLHPGFADALVERGTMKYEAGDVAGARIDWTAVLTGSANGAAAAVARQHLADTDPAPAAPTAAASPPSGATPPLALKPPKAH